MAYLHSYNIIHRDLQPNNIFIDDNFFPKIFGFDIAKVLKNGSPEKSNKIKGTPIYIAPEVYLNKEYRKASDVYSFSLIIYELFTGNKPFTELNSPSEIKDKIAHQNQRPTFQEPINQYYRELIERCWNPNPEQRPTFEEIKHELKTNPNFITDKINNEEYQKYIKFIEYNQISFNDSENMPHFDYILKYLNKNNENNFKINFRDINETELVNVLFDYEFTNLSNFEKKKLINYNDFNEYGSLKTYLLCNKKTDHLYFGEKVKLLYNIKRKKLSKEITHLIDLNHPSISKFIGYSPNSFKNEHNPIIITEYGLNGSLKSILDFDMNKESNLILNYTKRISIIYGIASGMAYLHSHDIIHCKLNTSNIYLDEFLLPKIVFALNTKTISTNPIPDIYQLILKPEFSIKNIYAPPEYYLHDCYSSASDVYSFAFIAYQLITNKKPFLEVTDELIHKLCFEKYRPKFSDSVPECIQKLIEKCWAHDPKERPSFDEILYILKTNDELINNTNLNKEEYQYYIDFIEKTQSNNDIGLQIDEKILHKKYIDINKLRKYSRLNFCVNMKSIDLSKFEKLERIGSGGFGVVYKVEEEKTGNVYAAKVSKYRMDKCQNDTIINLSREIEIISKMNHPSILQFIGFNPNDFKNNSKPVIITELAPNGSLDKIIEKERIGFGNIKWNDTKKLINIYGIAAAMAYLHSQDIIHRDLKPANILLDENLYPKIADFGLSKIQYEDDKIVSHNKEGILSGFKGTLAYCAPEILEKQMYSKAGDIYAFGMIVYEIMTNEILYEGLNQFQLIHYVHNKYRPEIKMEIPYCYEKLIKKCWKDCDANRPSFDKIVKTIEKDKTFITQNVDEEEFLNYISLIKEPTNTIYKTVNKVSFEEKCFEKNNDNNINYEGQKSFLDLSKFNKLSAMYKSGSMKLYQLQDNETGLIYAGQVSMHFIKKMTENQIKDLEAELQKIKKLNHPSLLKFIGYSPTDFKNTRKPVIVTECAINRSLYDILKNERTNETNPKWDDTQKLINIFGIISGMSYLHAHDIIHRSLKPENIYLDDLLTPKIGDFGLSTRFENSESISYQSISGNIETPRYSAPEVLALNEYTKSSDVYAFSMIVYEIITNELPFEDISNNNQIIDDVVNYEIRPKLCKSIPKSYRNLIERCWSQEKEERPTFDEIVYILKADVDFITDNVNNEKYQKYINYIEEQTKFQFISIKIDENAPAELDLIKEETIQFYKEEAEKGNYEAQAFLAIKYSKENDTENIYEYFSMLIKSGNCTIPLEYAIKLYNSKQYKQAFNYFTLISKTNHPISLFFIGLMKFKGLGCHENRDESYRILKHLSDNGIDRATEFLEDHFQFMDSLS